MSPYCFRPFRKVFANFKMVKCCPSTLLTCRARRAPLCIHVLLPHASTCSSHVRQGNKSSFDAPMLDRCDFSPVDVHVGRKKVI